MRAISLISILMTVWIPLGARAGTTFYVAPPPLGDDANPGTEELPFATIQKGIDTAEDGDTVIVAEGTYFENIHFNGKNITLRSTDPLDPSVVEKTAIDGNPAAGRDSVVTFSGTEDETCVLSGFTIQNGQAYDGGGIVGGSATIQNNLIRSNTAVGEWEEACVKWIFDPDSGELVCTGWESYLVGGDGGGLAYCRGVIQNNTIEANSAQGRGGGLYSCRGTIRDNRIFDNSSYGLEDCDGEIRGNVIRGNSEAGLRGCDGAVRKNVIEGNARLGLFECDATVENNLIADNPSGGLEFCDGTIRNNLIVANGGSGLMLCDGVVQNNTIVDNGHSVGFLGGGVDSCEASIENCVIWGNSTFYRVQIKDSSVPSYCCIQDWAAGGEGNISEDPRFVDPDGPDDNPDTYEDNDYHLSEGSPCIDAGKNGDWMWDAFDLDGNPRIMPGASFWRVDMGAYEYTSPTYKFTQFLRESSNGIQIIWTSEPGRSYTIWSSIGLPAGIMRPEKTVSSQGQRSSWTDTLPSVGMKFYRIKLPD